MRASEQKQRKRDIEREPSLFGAIVVAVVVVAVIIISLLLLNIHAHCCCCCCRPSVRSPCLLGCCVCCACVSPPDAFAADPPVRSGTAGAHRENTDTHDRTKPHTHKSGVCTSAITGNKRRRHMHTNTHTRTHTHTRTPRAHCCCD